MNNGGLSNTDYLRVQQLVAVDADITNLTVDSLTLLVPPDPFVVDSLTCNNVATIGAVNSTGNSNLGGATFFVFNDSRVGINMFPVLGKALAVTGDVDLKSKLDVLGTTTLNELNTLADANINGGLIYATKTPSNKVGINTVAPTNHLSVNGNTNINGFLTVGTTLDVLGGGTTVVDLTTTGQVNLSSDLIVNNTLNRVGVKNFSPNTDFSVTGNADISGTLGIGSDFSQHTGTCTVWDTNTPILNLRCGNESSDATLAFSTTETLTIVDKTKIIAQGIGSASRANLHICSNNVVDNSSATIADAKISIDGQTGVVTIPDVLAVTQVRPRTDLTNNHVRPPVTTTRYDWHHWTAPAENLLVDHGFIRFKAGGGSNNTECAWIDLAGYNLNAGVTKSIVFGIGPTEQMVLREDVVYCNNNLHCTSNFSEATFKMPIHDTITGFHNIGEMYSTTAGVIWVCTAAGTPGTWTTVGSQ